MKRLLTLTALAVMAAVGINANPINQKRASRLALEFMANPLNEPVLVKKAQFSSGNLKKKFATTLDYAPYYIYSRGENQGFVIVSGDDALPEILGYTESGDLDESNMPPFLTWYLSYYTGLVEAAQDAGTLASLTPSYAAERVDVAPLIETHWHQSSPYNDKCPTRKDGGGRCITGCVATAASQIAYYWRKDLPHETKAATTSYEDGDANFTTAFPKGTQLKWELMLTQYSSEPSEYRDAVATLLAVIGGGAHLDYGSSTAGYNANCIDVYKNILGMNGGKEYNKDWGQDYNNYSDEAWSTLLYNELIKSHPILYSGCNANGEGHAVVIDGYQAKNDLFHFNLGWGNPSTYDGYFTVARGQSPSWGFNNSWQECVIDIYPKQQNLSATINPPSTVYKNIDNTVKVKIANNGTLDYSGVYLFGNSTGSKPTSLSSAKDKDLSTILKNDGSETEIRMTVKPTTDDYWLIITDNNLNVITKCQVTAKTAETDLVFEKFAIDGSKETDNGYTLVYNDRTQAKATLRNDSFVPYEGNVKINLYAAEDGGESFSLVTTKQGKISIPAKSSAEASISILSSTAYTMSRDLRYCCTIQPETTAGEGISFAESTDTIARFILKGSDLEATDYTDGCLKLSGHWDPITYNTLTKRSAYKAATSYDLTEVQSVMQVPQPYYNPNALNYVATEDVSGYNVVCGTACKNLTLTPGYDFRPKYAFTAAKATVELDFTPAKWTLFTAPCDLKVPYGIVARTIDSHTTSGINNKTTEVTEMKAGRTYIVMTSSSRISQFTGTESSVVITTEQNPDTALVGTFVCTTTPAGAMMIDMEENQYFQPVDQATEVPALGGYFLDPKVTKAFRAYSSLTTDSYYQHLAEAIEVAYDAIDDYADLISDNAYNTLLDSISQAEQIFTLRTLSRAIEIKALTANLDATVDWFVSQVVNPGTIKLDYTAFITNPSFETGKTTGWTVSDMGSVLVKKTTENNYRGVGSDGDYLAYSNTSGAGSELSQTVERLPAGIYTLTAKVGTGSELAVTLFAGDSLLSVPANSFGEYYLTEASIENIEVRDGESLTIGIKAGDWYKADDFRLTMTKSIATGIGEVKADNDRRASVRNSDASYNLQGFRVNDSYQGLIIRAGKKTVKK